VDYDGWLKVPGCGPYTSAVLSSICNNEKVASVDGNAVRVIARLHSWTEEVWSPKGQKRIKNFLQEQIQSSTCPGDFNQGIMEMGQELCTIKSPGCHECFLSKYCLAFEQDLTEDCPPPKPKKPTIDVNLIGVVPLSSCGSKVALGRRISGFLKGTVGFGLVRGDIPGDIPGNSLLDGLSVVEGGFKHTITRHKIKGTVASFNGGTSDLSLETLNLLSIEEVQWIEFERVADQLSSSLDKKIWRLFTKAHGL